MTDIASNVKVVPAIAPSAGTIGTMTAIEVDCTGFDYVTYLLELGTAAAGGLIDMKIQDSVTSGGALVDVPSAILTQVTKANGDGKVMIIQCRVNPGRVFQKALVVTSVGAFPNGVIAVLHGGSGAYPKALLSGQQRVIV